MDVPIDYHVTITMLEHYQRHIAKAGQHNAKKKDVLSMIQNYLLHAFMNKAIVSFCNRL